MSLCLVRWRDPLLDRLHVCTLRRGHDGSHKCRCGEHSTVNMQRITSSQASTCGVEGDVL